MAEENIDDEVVLERISDDEDNLNDPEWIAKAGSRIDPILKHMQVGETPVDKDKMRDQFIKIWDMEKCQLI